MTARLGLPSVRVIEVGVADCSLTVATSPRRTGSAGRPARQVPDLLDGREARADLDGLALPALGERPGGHRRPAGLQRLAERLGVQPGGGELLLVGGDRDDPVLDAVHRDLADAVDVLQVRDDAALELVGERLLVLVPGGDGEDDGGDVVRRAGHHLRVDVLGQLRAGAVHGLLDIGDQALGVVAVVELRHDDARALARRRGDALDAVDRLDTVLERLDHLLLDDIGGGALVRRQHGHHREFDGRQELLLELWDRDGAEGDRHDRHQRYQAPLYEAESGQPGHGWGLSSVLKRTAGPFTGPHTPSAMP